MGEVYRARDARLDRDVAIKILPELFAVDPDRVARFEREAKTLASLNHPNIAQVHGIEDANGVRALVMELVEGDDLSARTVRGALPLDEALPIARQIADALEAAHERGIIHRDLKPANIKVREDGTVKVLDFGLAKALDRAAGSHPDLMHSPTITSPMTQMGVILGTAAYMAPEQAKGRALDRRADVWAFGCVLFEMLTGRRAFPGEDVTDTLAAIVRGEPEWGALPADTPDAVRRVLRRCLQKERAKRLDSMGAARLDIDDAMRGEAAPAVPQPVMREDPAWRRAAPWAVAALAVAAAGAVALTARPAAPATPLRLSIALPDGHRVTAGPIISRDGRRIVFASGTGSGQPKLYERTLGAFELRELAGTEGADRPFFAPDGRSIGFFARSELFTLDLDGGAPVPVAAAPTPGGGTWADDGTIVFTPTWNGGLYRIAGGGRPELLIRPNAAKKEYAYTSPFFLPGGEALLFSVWGATFDISRLSLPGLEREVVAPGFWTSTVYATSGHLLIGNNQGDVQALAYAASGAAAAPVSVLEKVHWTGGEGNGVFKFAVSDSGTLVYAPGDIGQRSLAIVDESGRIAPVPAEPAIYLGARISLDGRRAAVGQGGQAWMVDLERGTRTPVAPEQRTGAQSAVIWSADGARIIFASNVEGNWEIYSANPAQPGKIEAVLRKESDQFPTAVATDGTLLFDETRPGTGRDMWLLSPDGTATAWLATPANEGYGTFSPDGQLILYGSDATGRDEVYVQARTGGSGRVAVSTNGGVDPMWSPEGNRIFYREGNAMMAADIATGGALSVSPPRRLFDGGWELPSGASFAVMPDGKRFLMVRFAPAATPTRLDVVLNWFQELRRRAPLK